MNILKNIRDKIMANKKIAIGVVVAIVVVYFLVN
jgi:hypothetical protein